jgi:hypothetical protein
MLRHSDDFAVAAEYAIGRPIPTVNFLSPDWFFSFSLSSCNVSGVGHSRHFRPARRMSAYSLTATE